jgi:hypothetical protein
LFIFHRQRYQAPNSFENAIRQQINIESSKRIIAVKGLNPAHMFHFSEILRANFPKIEDIFATPKTFDLNPGGQPLGRYNPLCNKDEFFEIATSLSNSLETMYHTFLTQKNIESSALQESVEVISRFPGKRGQRHDDTFSETTVQSRDSFISNCVSLLLALEFPAATDETTFPAPPPPAWTRDNQPGTNLPPFSNSQTTHHSPTPPSNSRPTYVHAATFLTQQSTPTHQSQTSVPPPPPDPLYAQLFDTIQQLTLQNQQLQQQMLQLQATMSAQQSQNNPPTISQSVTTTPSQQGTTSAPAVDSSPEHPQAIAAFSILMNKIEEMTLQFKAQQSEIAIIRDYQLSHPSQPTTSPPRKRLDSKASPVNSPPSFHPDGTPTLGEMQDDDVNNDSF